MIDDVFDDYDVHHDDYDIIISQFLSNNNMSQVFKTFCVCFSKNSFVYSTLFITKVFITTLKLYLSFDKSTHHDYSSKLQG